MARHKDANWTLNDPIQNWVEVQVSVLMDIRDELKSLNSILGCVNFLHVPETLRRIQENTRPNKRTALRKKA